MPREALQEISQAISAAGLVQRGGFVVGPSDTVPEVKAGQPANTLMLLGNAGPEMWKRFDEARTHQRMTLDEWSEAVIGELADKLGARPLFPFSKPYLPCQTWAQRAEACFVSPIGMSIHPSYGLWHAYRGALAFAERLDVPQYPLAISPCETCVDQPCLTSCPVEAFSRSGYDTMACTGHLASAAGADCLSQGCLARRACPVGREFTYEPAQGAISYRRIPKDQSQGLGGKISLPL